jgi:hypothetical protein
MHFGFYNGCARKLARVGTTIDVMLILILFRICRFVADIFSHKRLELEMAMGTRSPIPRGEFLY